jgi:indolepyruvate ferredoxin oxidoreductase
MPGVNEDLAATAVWGTQQLATMGDATVDGVFGLWYGKGPGVDRAGDPLKHGNYAGTHPHGGVLVVTGDDHQGKSSTIAHHSQQALAAQFDPGAVSGRRERVRAVCAAGLGAQSATAGCWVGLQGGQRNRRAGHDLRTGPGRLSRSNGPRARRLPPEGVHYRGTFTPAQDEVILRAGSCRWCNVRARQRASTARHWATAERPAGHRHRRQDLARGAAGLRAAPALARARARARALGVAVYKVGLLWPLEPEGPGRIRGGKQELFFVEDKSAFVESQAAAILYNRPQRPRITGKADETGRPLLNADVGFEAIDLALVIAARLQALGLADDDELAQRVQALHASRRTLLAVMAPAEARRTPFFCSGCPHNTSTVLPEGSQGMAGIGCHGMAMFARPGTMLASQMGGEGLTWVGMSRYTKRQHVFQNLGDGTYYHSGLLAIRAAVASGANITYKILYNDAVAMTGGQPVDGPISPARDRAPGDARRREEAGAGQRRPVAPQRVRCRRCAHRTPRPAGRRAARTARHAGLHGAAVRADLCGRKAPPPQARRVRRPRPPHVHLRRGVRRLWRLRGAVHCVSIEPKDTPLGRKRRINQSSCNKDYSCVKGFCPSFVTVQAGTPRKLKPAVSPDAAFASLPAPAEAALDGDAFGVMIPGIGGTGVITVGAVLAMAAHLEGKAASTYDMTGLSQKNGAVYSHLQIAPDVPALRTHRLGLGDASLVLGFDMVAALADESFRTLAPGRTRFIGNHRVQPTAAVAMNPDARLDFGLLARKVTDKLGADHVRYLDATGLATALMGDAIATNFFVVGAALQLGWLPVSLAAVEKAIALNGMQVEFNLRALRYGRTVGARPGRDRPRAGRGPAGPGTGRHADAGGSGRRPRAAADRLPECRLCSALSVPAGRRACGRAARGGPGRGLQPGRGAPLCQADDGEGRIRGGPAVQQPGLQGQAGRRVRRRDRPAFPPGAAAVRAPRPGHRPNCASANTAPGCFGAMRWLARFKGLRGTAFDLFGRTEERQMERGLIDDYERRIEALLPMLDRARLPLATRIAEVADRVRGYGPVKEKAMAEAAAAWRGLDLEWAAQAAPVPERVA